MDFLRPASWEEALAAKAEHPTAVPIAGGTDVMVEINFDHRRPEYLLDLNRIGELYEWEVGEETRAARRLRPVHRGSWRTCAPSCPASPSPRTRSPPRRSATAAASAATSAPPPRPATPTPRCSPRAPRSRPSPYAASRLIPIDDFYTGVKRNALAADELIRAVHIKKADGPQQYSKVGTRNAMVIAVCAFGLALHPETRTVRTGIGSAAPTPVRAKAAEEFLNAALEEGGFWESGKIITPSVAKQFAELAAGACNPIDDVRGTRRATAATRSASWPAARWAGPGSQYRGSAAAPLEGSAHHARELHGQRPAAGSRRRVGGRVPAVRPARAHGPARLQERLRAGRVRLLHGPPRRRAGLLVPGRRRPGRGPRGRHRRGPGGLRQAPRRTPTPAAAAPPAPAAPRSTTPSSWQARPTDAQTGEGAELSPIQQAFIDAGAVQCGFCTPGLLVAADELLERNPRPSDADIREALSGNLCRCTGYEKILDAVRLAAARQGEAV